MKQPLDAICAAISRSAYRPIIAIASGGSVAAADYLAALHTHFTGYQSFSQTPLDFLRSEARLHYSSLWLLSAGGNNVDIRRTVRHALVAEPAQLTLLCAATGSHAAAQLNLVDAEILEYVPPSGEDGFLATNSLAAFLVMVGRAYAKLVNISFPQTLEELLASGIASPGSLESITSLIAPLLLRETWLVPFDPLFHSVATDLESRFSEAALGSIMISDLRNFAHGRHHWLAKNEHTSAVFAISCPSSHSLTRNTLTLLPQSIPRAELSLSDSPILGPLAGVFSMMHIAGLAGIRKNIDPGRPGVPRFGSQVYRLATPTGPTYPRDKFLIAIARKLHQPIRLLRLSAITALWRASLLLFLADLYKNPILAIVFDYDGTLVGVLQRFTPPQDDVRMQITRLLEAGVRIGIATGRGDSVRNDLRKVIPRQHWPNVTVGYHNGAELATLDIDSIPAGTEGLEQDIARCKLELESINSVSELIRISPSRFQLSIQWKELQLGWKLLDFIKPLIERIPDLSVQIVSSGHSVDILSKTVSKMRVVEHLTLQHGIAPESILAIGDQGWYPGNDHALLSHRPSLSVDQVSRDASTCWRLSPPSVRGPAATLWYLSKLTSHKRKFGVRFTNGSLLSE